MILSETVLTTVLYRYNCTYNSTIQVQLYLQQVAADCSQHQHCNNHSVETAENNNNVNIFTRGDDIPFLPQWTRDSDWVMENTGTVNGHDFLWRDSFSLYVHNIIVTGKK